MFGNRTQPPSHSHALPELRGHLKDFLYDNLRSNFHTCFPGTHPPRITMELGTPRINPDTFNRLFLSLTRQFRAFISIFYPVLPRDLPQFVSLKLTRHINWLLTNLRVSRAHQQAQRRNRPSRSHPQPRPQTPTDNGTVIFDRQINFITSDSEPESSPEIQPNPNLILLQPSTPEENEEPITISSDESIRQRRLTARNLKLRLSAYMSRLLLTWNPNVQTQNPGPQYRCINRQHDFHMGMCAAEQCHHFHETFMPCNAFKEALNFLEIDAFPENNLVHFRVSEHRNHIFVEPSRKYDAVMTLLNHCLDFFNIEE